MTHIPGNMQFTSELLTFDMITQLIIITSIIVMYLKTKELYSLSLQKGIKYLNKAMLYYLIGFLAWFARTIFDFISDGIYGSHIISYQGLFLTFLNIYGSLVGGFFLAYCLVWRKFDKDLIKKNKTIIPFILHILSFIIVALDIYLILAYKFIAPFFFFTSAIVMILYAITTNCIRSKKLNKLGKDLNPFLSLVGIGLGVYIVTFLESLFTPFLFTVHYYSSALSVVFSLAFMYNVLRIAK